MAPTISPLFWISVASLVAYAFGLKMLTSVVFRKIVVSTTYVSLTKKDIFMILIYFTLFFNGMVLFVSSIPEQTGYIPVAATALRGIVALLAVISGYAAMKYNLYEEFA